MELKVSHFREPKCFFDILPNEIKKMETVETFKGDITYGNRKNVRADFVSAT